MSDSQLKNIIEAALLAAGRSLDISAIESLFDAREVPPRNDIRAALTEIDGECIGHGYELKRTGSGYRLQIKKELAPWINRLWEEKPKKYSRAMLETLALVAYRQPVTRGDIEQVRGVTVSSEIIRTLLDREWIRSVGHRDVPGRPALYATTRNFLDDFNLASLDELPPLSEIRDIEIFSEELGFAPAENGAELAEADGDGEAVTAASHMEKIGVRGLDGEAMDTVGDAERNNRGRGAVVIEPEQERGDEDTPSDVTSPSS
jgi:segregation and condensation protein B